MKRIAIVLFILLAFSCHAQEQRHTYAAGTEKTLNNSNVVVHYTLSGTDAVNSDADAQRVLDIIAYCWNKQVNIMGWRQPLADNGLGGDTKLDFYIYAMGGTCLHGITCQETALTNNTATVFIGISNTCVNNGTTTAGENTLKIIIAHEFNHASQYAYTNQIYEKEYPSFEYWIGEMTAVTVSDLTFDNTLQDYLNAYNGNILPCLQTNNNPIKKPWSSLSGYSTSDRHFVYSGLWTKFLAEWKDGNTILKRIWSEFASQPSPVVLREINTVLQNPQTYDSDIQEAYKQYAVWRLFTGQFAMGQHFIGAADMADAEFTACDNNSQTSVAPAYYPSGANYLIYDNSPGYMKFEFTGQGNGVHWGAVVIKFNLTTKAYEVTDVNINQSNYGSVELFDPQHLYENVCFVPVIIGADKNSYGKDTVVYPRTGIVTNIAQNIITFTNRLPAQNNINLGGSLNVDGVTIASGSGKNLPDGSHTVKTNNERFTAPLLAKHQNWNIDINSYSLTKNFTVNSLTHSMDACFVPMQQVTVQNKLIEYPNYTVTNSSISFLDPWYLDENNNQAGLFRTNTSPYQPNGSYFASPSEKGVFLSRISGSFSYPYYSVKSETNSTIYVTATGRTHKAYFQNWNTDNGNAFFQNALSTETGVDFRQAGTVVSANYKAAQLSNSLTGFMNNNQRKYITPQNGVQYYVYESMNKIWLENNFSSEWTILNNAAPLNVLDGHNPSMDYMYSQDKTPSPTLIAAFEESDPNNYCTNLVVERIFGTYVDARYVYSIPDVNFTEPVIASLDNSKFIVISKIISEDDNYLYGFYFKINAQNNIQLINTFQIENSDVNSKNPSLSVLKQLTTNSNFHLVWSQENPGNGSSQIMYKVINLNNDVITQTTAVSISNGSAFEKNQRPSIISLTNSPCVVWTGFRDGLIAIDDLSKGDNAKTLNNASSVVFRDPANPRFWTFGSNVLNANINKRNDNLFFMFGWSEDDGQYTNKYADNSLSTIKTILRTDGTALKGKDVQICNGETRNTMSAMAYNYQSIPYYFTMSGTMLPKENNAGKITEGREGVLYKDNAQVYFTVGDIKVNDQKIEFVDLSNTEIVNTLDQLNTYLVSKPFDLNDNSIFYYSVQYGTTDTVAVKNLLNGNTANINFRVELLDAQTDELLGSYDNISFSAANYKSHRNISYKVNTAGIGNRTVKLRLKIVNEIPLYYSLTKKIKDDNELNKVITKEISYNGSLAVKEYGLSQNYPNPFNPATTINYQLPKNGQVTIKVYDILGNEVKTLVNDYKSAGSYNVNFDASKLSSGVYIYRIVAGDYTVAKKMTLLK